MEIQVPSSIIDFFNSHSAFVIVGHKEPDGDCIGSQLALESFLRRRGKECLLCSSGPFKRTEIKEWESSFSSTIDGEFLKKNPACVVLDCSSISRIGSLEPEVQKLPLAFIDHHAVGESCGQASYVDPHAPAVTYLILKLIEAFGQTPTREEAEYLFFGLCTDTGFFRHLDTRSAPFFQGAARLVEAGASPTAAFVRMYGGKSIESRLLLGLILSRLERFFSDRLIYSYETLEDSKAFGLEGRDSDMLYQLIQSVSGCEAVVIIRQESVEACTVGFRSRESIDVAEIAASLGGGGHRQASGLYIAGTIPDVKEKILKAFEASLLQPR